MNSDLPLILPDWNAPSNVVAYCTTKEGGFSQGDYAGLNVGAHVGDNPQTVEENRERLPHSRKICWLNQVHGCNVVTLPSQDDDADASISSSPAYFCAVMTADCVPVLLCNEQGSEVAAIHAGWKGLQLDVIEHTVAKMQSKPQALKAWIGPAISQACYEVPESVAKHFVQYPGAVVRSANPDKFLVDLPFIAKHQLSALGIRYIHCSNLCTYQDPRFFSHRQATHNQQLQTGRIVSVIGLCTE